MEWRRPKTNVFQTVTSVYFSHMLSPYTRQWSISSMLRVNMRRTCIPVSNISLLTGKHVSQEWKRAGNENRRQNVPRKKAVDSDRLDSSMLGATSPKTRPICWYLSSCGNRTSRCSNNTKERLIKHLVRRGFHFYRFCAQCHTAHPTHRRLS